MLISAVILKLLQTSGALPDLNRDVYDEELIQAGEGRYLSPEIGYTKRGSTAVSDRLYKVQQFMIANPLVDSMRINLSEAEQKQLLIINTNWLVYHLESDIKSLQLFLQSLS
jgi:recombinational DNA repair protein (RecF pathway)